MKHDTGWGDRLQSVPPEGEPVMTRDDQFFERRSIGVGKRANLVMGILGAGAAMLSKAVFTALAPFQGYT